MSSTKSRILSAIFRQLNSRPGFDTIGIENYRNLLEKSALAFKPDKSIKKELFYIDNIEAQWIIPPGHNKNHTVMYIHGGGFIAGSIKSHEDLASRIAAAANAKVLLFNYRLAPEHPFPAGLEDVLTIYKWLTDGRDQQDKISIAADSAGGNLALALISILLKKSLPLPVCSVLFSPWVDLECKNRSIIENRKIDPMLNLTILQKTATLYSGSNDLADPLISTVNSDLKGACPILIQTGENELLVDDSKILAHKLEKVNAVVKLEIWKDMFHVWHYFARYLSEGRQAIEEAGNFIRKHSLE